LWCWVSAFFPLLYFIMKSLAWKCCRANQEFLKLTCHTWVPFQIPKCQSLPWVPSWLLEYSTRILFMYFHF
jgi:hypothetical protein